MLKLALSENNSSDGVYCWDMVTHDVMIGMWKVKMIEEIVNKYVSLVLFLIYI